MSQCICKRIKTCRICLGDSLENNSSRFIHPCRCIGNLKHVHRDCLNTWRQYQINYNKDPNCCDICQTPFLFQHNNYPDFASHVLILLPVAVFSGLLADQLKCNYMNDQDTLSWTSSFYYAIITCGLIGSLYTLVQTGIKHLWTQPEIIVDLPLFNLFIWVLLNDKDDWIALFGLGFYFYCRSGILFHEDWRKFRSRFKINYQKLEIIDTCDYVNVDFE